MSKLIKNYNGGILEFIKKEVETDKYNTPIKVTNVSIGRFWFRQLGITSNELYQAMQIDTVIKLRVAIRLYVQLDHIIDSDLRVMINNKVYSIIRVFHNSTKNETELSLSEVVKHDKHER